MRRPCEWVLVTVACWTAFAMGLDQRMYAGPFMKMPGVSWDPTSSLPAGTWNLGIATVTVHTDGSMSSFASLSLNEFYPALFPDGDADGKTFPAHLHAGACAQRLGHYQKPGGDGSATAANEAWPFVSCTEGAKRCEGSAMNTWQPLLGDLTAGMSIVVHDETSNQRILCADLVPALFGELRPVPGYLSFYGAPRGQALAVHTGTETVVFVRLMAEGKSLYRRSLFQTRLNQGACSARGSAYKVR